MATVDQIKPLFLDQLRDALNRRIDASNRVGSMMRLADDLGADIGTVKGWVYGDTTPNGAAVVALIAHYGPDFAQEVLYDLTGVHCSLHPDASSVRIAELEQAIDAVEKVRRDGNFKPETGL